MSRRRSGVVKAERLIRTVDEVAEIFVHVRQQDPTVVTVDHFSPVHDFADQMLQSGPGWSVVVSDSSQTPGDYSSARDVIGELEIVRQTPSRFVVLFTFLKAQSNVWRNAVDKSDRSLPSTRRGEIVTRRAATCMKGAHSRFPNRSGRILVEPSACTVSYGSTVRRSLTHGRIEID